jgi:hypothetical protein
VEAKPSGPVLATDSGAKTKNSENQNHSSTKQIAQIQNMSKEENQTTQLKIQK